MSANIPGIVAVVIFYIIILVVGIVTGRKTGKSLSNEAVLVADRKLGLFVSIFTMTATMVGGGYINGSAESAAYSGVLWTQAPIGYCLALFVGGFFYAPKMREENYITMFDPFQLKYGKKVGALLTIPQFLGDLFWSAAVLSALGATISIILDMSSTLAIILSAAVAILYTFTGGMYAVAYTDVIQLILIAIGLIIAFPFCLAHQAVDLTTVSGRWLGEVPTSSIASYIDIYLLCIMGGIPWQSFFQRSLASRTVHIAKWSALIAGVFSMSMAIPPMMMGIAASATDWNLTTYDDEIPIPEDRKRFILPIALSYLTPLPVSIIGTGAIAAAVMSSADSCILASSSVFTWNIYTEILRPKASERELMWVLRIAILVVGVLGSAIAIFSTTIYGLYLMCSDLIYVVLFPQLTLVLWMPKSNSYGSVVGFFVSLFLRLLSGEPVIHLPAVIKYPYYDEVRQEQLFPFRTFCMLMGAVCIVVVSLVTHYVFVNEKISRKYDLLRIYQLRSIKRRSNLIKEKEDIDDKVDDQAAMPLQEGGTTIM
ncbi:high-affinity choline transporter 1-like [Physella acuta]|uniref:high-affinity choline transporter 1-like n=1 Tax=Physella acuta TaxID=109671 RepID=UPI0027DAC5FC|nr:high-affinity choline transporter 1-like [Physella acuta]XP_059144287.1 high-affinity choline transporter 1-like [Physella acuta]